MSALFELTRMRVLLLLRQPEVLFWAFGFPILLTLVLGLAFRDRGVSPSRVALLGARAAAVRDVLAAAPGVEPELARDEEEARRRLRSGAVDLVVETGEGLALAFDPSRPEAETARLRVVEALQEDAGRSDPLAIEERAVTDAGSRFVDWFVPGLLGLSVMSTSVWAVGFAFVEARQRRLTRRLLVTPMRRTTYLGAHVLARLLLLVLEVAVLLAFARFALGVPFRGSLAAFFVLAVIGALAFSAVGILLGSRVRTIEGAAGLINVTMMPLGLSSGVFFSYERFSEGVQPWIRALPLAPFIDALRAVMLEGRGLAALAPEIAIQLGWGLAAFALGLALFRWK